MRRFMPALLAVFAGWITAFAMPPAGLWPCLFIGLSTLYYLWQQTETKKTTFLISFLFGLGFFTTGLWWIGNALLIEGNEFWWVWPISVIGLPMLLSFFTAFYLMLGKMAFPRSGFAAWIGFAVMLTLSEWIRGHIFTGFPWNLYGYGWARVEEILQSASLFGAYGLTLITVLCAAVPALIWLHRRSALTYTSTAFSIAVLGGLFFYGAARLETHPIQSDAGTIIRIVQPNITQAAKWQPDQIVPNFDKTIALSEKPLNATPQTIYVLWPETAIPPVLLENNSVRQRIGTMLRSLPGNAALLTGALQRQRAEDGTTRYYNSLVTFNDQGFITSEYSKTHLVPFGEFIPFQEWIPLTPVVQFSGFEPGNGPVTMSAEGGPTFSPLICYEIIFPDKAVDQAARPDFIAAITNDGWYGDSAGPRQHFFQARIRAIEEGLPVMRSANTGISGAIDPLGRIIADTPLMEGAIIDVPLPDRLDSPPIFARFGQFLWLGMILVSGTLAFFLRLKA